MTNRKALRITNGSVLYYRDLKKFGKKRKKTKQEKLEEKIREFNPNLYYGVRNT
tara:strand:+ start:184 stop:345 length:162 start_codon:yes stop_codon:yes gene_type:complete